MGGEASWLGKVALAVALGLALSIWFLTADRTGTAPPMRTGPEFGRSVAAPPAPRRHARAKQQLDAAARTRAAARAARSAYIADESERVKEANVDPNSMFDMSTA